MFIHYRQKRSPCFIIVLSFVLFFFTLQNLAYAEDSSKEDKFNKEFLKKFKADFIKVSESPVNWGRRDILSFSAILGTGVLLYIVDQDIHDWFQDHRNPSTDDISQFVSPFGHGVFLGALIASLYASGEIFQQNSLRKTALLSLESWLTAGVVVLGLKVITGRARPSPDKNSHTFRPFSFCSSFYSFPSGHAASAFAVAAVIADQSEIFAVDFLAYTLSTLVAVSRVHDRQHWASDVFIGSAIGYFIGKKISALNRNQRMENVSVSFQISPQRQAVTLSISF